MFETIEAYADHIIEFVRQHQVWAVPVVFALAFGESLAFMSRHPTLIPKGEAFVKKWGVLAIFIGRFFGPLRASVPLVAGIFEMPYWRFQFANFTSAFIWAAVLLTLGDVVAKGFKLIWG